jgi:MFS family permease
MPLVLVASLGACPALLGPLAAAAVIALRPDTPLQYLFFLALLPGLASAALALFAVRDIPHPAHPGAAPPPLLQRYPTPLWHLIAAAALFSLGNSSDAFLILRSRELGLSFTQVVLAFALYNAIYALGALPLGRLSDRVGRKPVVIAGWLVYALVYLGFAAAKSAVAPRPLLAAYGLYQALSEGITKALIADVVPTHQRAGAIGLFYTVTGLAQLVASLAAGLLWPVHLLHARLMAPFLLGALCATLAIPLIATVRTSHPPQHP